MRVGVIGVGHVGLVTGAALAELGHEVVAMDLDEAKIELLRSGKTPFYEPELDELIARQTATGRLLFRSEPAEAVGDAEVLFICVGLLWRAGEPILAWCVAFQWLSIAAGYWHWLIAGVFPGVADPGIVEKAMWLSLLGLALVSSRPLHGLTFRNTQVRDAQCALSIFCRTAKSACR